VRQGVCAHLHTAKTREASHLLGSIYMNLVFAFLVVVGTTHAPVRLAPQTHSVSANAFISSIRSKSVGPATTHTFTTTTTLQHYRYTAAAGSATISLDGIGCPRTQYGTRGLRFGINDSLGVCTNVAGGSKLTFSIPQGKQLSMQRTTGGIAVSLTPIPTHKRFHPPHASRITQKYFDVDAESRTMGMLDIVQRTAAVREVVTRQNVAQGRATLRIPQTRQKMKLVVHAPVSFSGSTGTVAATRVAYIAWGGDESDQNVFTREYWYVYNSKTGSLLQYGDKIVSDSVAKRFGFAPNHLGIAEGAL
jgi:hypothetical protein